jgi:pimeloyl-ACP methyl ester carboxylesterase
MHGWAGSGAYFDDVVAAMDLTDLRAVTLDLRGHGRSEPSDTTHDLEQTAADVLAVADAAGAERFLLVGFSMSAKFAQFVARRAPDRVLGLALLAGSPACELPFPAEMQREWVACAGDREALGQLISQFVAEPAPTAAFHRFLDDAVMVSARALDETLVACLRTSFDVDPRVLSMPVLVIGGRRDPIFPPAGLATAMRAALPHARTVFVDCGHEIPLERPQQLAALVEAFVAGLRRE